MFIAFPNGEKFIPNDPEINSVTVFIEQSLEHVLETLLILLHGTSLRKIILKLFLSAFREYN